MKRRELLKLAPVVAVAAVVPSVIPKENPFISSQDKRELTKRLAEPHPDYASMKPAASPETLKQWETDFYKAYLEANNTDIESLIKDVLT